VAVGQSGTILTSSDGTSWTSRTSGTSIKLMEITFGNSTFVAVGQEGTILTSSDGTSWTSRTSGTSKGLLAVTSSEIQGNSENKTNDNHTYQEIFGESPMQIAPLWQWVF